MKKHLRLTALAALLLSAALLTACSGAEPETPPTAEAPSTEETQEITGTSGQEVCLITETPENNRYTSTDYGATWYCGGEEAEAPSLFLSMAEQEQLGFSAESTPKLKLHNESGRSLRSDYEFNLKRYENGEWLEAEYADDSKVYVSLGGAETLDDGQTHDVYIPWDRYKQIEGKYCYIVSFCGYQCAVTFDAAV